jgi:hypothetical protein
VSSQPSPLVACSITLTAAHHWDSAGIPSGGTAGFIFLMRIPFKDILTGNDVSVSTLMPGPKTTHRSSTPHGRMTSTRQARHRVALQQPLRASTRSRRSGPSLPPNRRHLVVRKLPPQ